VVSRRERIVLPRWLGKSCCGGGKVDTNVFARPLGRSAALFSATSFAFENWGRDYAVSSDDRRFLMVRPLFADAPDRLIVVENWFEELKRLP
jgi:hypothetical protein